MTIRPLPSMGRLSFTSSRRLPVSSTTVQPNTGSPVTASTSPGPSSESDRFASLPCSTRRSTTVSCRIRPLPIRTSLDSVLEKNNAPSATTSAERQAIVARPLAGRNPRQAPPNCSGTTASARSKETPLAMPSILTGTTTPAGSLKSSNRQSPLRVTGTTKSMATGSSPPRSATRS